MKAQCDSLMCALEPVSLHASEEVKRQTMVGGRGQETADVQASIPTQTRQGAAMDKGGKSQDQCSV